MKKVEVVQHIIADATMRKLSRKDKEMENYIIELISVAGTFIAAYLGKVIPLGIEKC
ncbi:MAG: hypothetical protein ACLR6I_15520 [Waltera sp.]